MLHWAKQLEFSKDGSKEESLNYDVRILGRKGILSFNAVGTMVQLSDINAHIPEVIKIAKFVDGNRYADFNPSVDKVAAYTIGGLVAGSILTKTGFFVLLLKYIKLILLAIFGGFAAFRKKIAGWFTKKKRSDDDDVTHTEIPVAVETTNNQNGQQEDGSNKPVM